MLSGRQSASPCSLLVRHHVGFVIPNPAIVNCLFYRNQQLQFGLPPPSERFKSLRRLNFSSPIDTPNYYTQLSRAKQSPCQPREPLSLRAPERARKSFLMLRGPNLGTPTSSSTPRLLLSTRRTGCTLTFYQTRAASPAVTMLESSKRWEQLSPMA